MHSLAAPAELELPTARLRPEEARLHAAVFPRGGEEGGHAQRQRLLQMRLQEEERDRAARRDAKRAFVQAQQHSLLSELMATSPDSERYKDLLAQWHHSPDYAAGTVSAWRAANESGSLVAAEASSHVPSLNFASIIAGDAIELTSPPPSLHPPAAAVAFESEFLSALRSAQSGDEVAVAEDTLLARLDADETWRAAVHEFLTLEGGEMPGDVESRVLILTAAGEDALVSLPDAASSSARAASIHAGLRCLREMTAQRGLVA